MDRSGHPPCSLLPESSWESFDARTSGSSCPCHGTTERIASQAGTGHDAPSVTGGASTDRVVGGGRSFQRTDCRKIGSYTTDGAQVASTVVGASCVSWKARSRTRRYRVGSARSWPTHPGAVVYRRAAGPSPTAFMSCAATRRRESRLWSEPLRHDPLSLDLSNSKMLTTSATTRARSLPTSKLPLVRSSLQTSVPLEMSTTSPTTSAALSL